MVRSAIIIDHNRYTNGKYLTSYSQEHVFKNIYLYNKIHYRDVQYKRENRKKTERKVFFGVSIGMIFLSPLVIFGSYPTHSIIQT